MPTDIVLAGSYGEQFVTTSQEQYWTVEAGSGAAEEVIFIPHPHSGQETQHST